MTDKATVLKEALKKERDSRVVLRIAAVNMVVVEGQSTGDAARYLMMSDDWVRKWADRYESGGLEASAIVRARGGRPRWRRRSWKKSCATRPASGCCRGMSTAR